MNKKCELTPYCEFEEGHSTSHPCGRHPQRPGEVCRLCGEIIPEGGCYRCWRPATVADLAALNREARIRKN